MKLNENFDQQEFIDWIEEFLPDFSKDTRKVDVPKGFTGVNSITTLGESALGVRVYVIETNDDPSRRKVGLATDSFNLLKNYGTPNAIIVYYSPNTSLWRISLLTSTPIWAEKKIITKLSNPKRQSYVLGSKAKVKTPHQYLLSKGKVTDFTDLKSRFSLEVVNKDFYKEISHAFIRLVGGTIANSKSQKSSNPLLKLPALKDSSQTNLEFAVRLIGRIIFCWFLREKRSASGHSLMPKELVSFDAANNTPDYYHRILEPIFFEILNKPIRSRKETFINDLFSAIPYLNGGLFSPHEDDFFNYNEGKQAINHNLVIVPDEWLKAFFEVLETYNFTIDENTSFDEELSIDPEMLGRIFENLLAEINPETGESARKSTGSYYTPRAIVDYMVDESLYLYLKNKTNIGSDKLKSLISYDLEDDTSNPLNDEEKDHIAQALGSIKILDPACGSGAFPIGAMQKIVFVLQQIDQHGQLWFKKQIQNTPIELRKVIEREFKEKNFDYIRKLGIIRENIYGIDIQPIATEISRLRCFLTLVVDERIDDSLENRGIEPLPNLDFKFVTANTLVGLPTSVGSVSQIGLFEDDQGIKELKEVRDMFFNASGFERDQLKLQFVQTQNKMFQKLISEGLRGHAEMTSMLTSWDPFSHKSSAWFDQEWMFGIKDGFDIVIANPPWVFTRRGDFDKKLKKIITDTYLKKLKGSQVGHAKQSGKINLFAIFILFAANILKKDGLMTFIIPNTLLRATIFDAIRKYLLDETSISSIVDLSKGIFENVTASTIVLILENTKPNQKTQINVSQSLPIDDKYNEWKVEQNSFLKNVSYGFNIYANDIGSSLINKILVNSERLDKYYKVMGGGIATGPGKKDYISNTKLSDLYKPLIEGKDVKRYLISFSDKYILYDRVKLYRARDEKVFLLDEKLVTQRIGGGRYPLVVGYDNNKYYTFNSTNTILKREDSNDSDLKYLLGLLNSKLLNWYFKIQYTNKSELTVNISKTFLEQLPIKMGSSETKTSLINSVNKMIDMLQKKHGDLDHDKKIEACEKQIDEIIYQIYDLSEDEIKTIEAEI